MRALVLAVVVTAFASGSAQAATTVGSSLRQRANLYVRCGGACTAIQTARPGGAGLTIPIDGVITRWRVRAATLGQMRLRVMRPEADGGYTAIEGGPWARLDRPHEPGHDILYEFPTRLVVHAGDVIAVDRDAKAGGIFHSYGDNATYAAGTFAPWAPDTAQDLKPTSITPGRELLVNADIEKDNDGDGFGDESQDNCPTIANDQTDKPCSTPTPQTTTPEGPTSTPVDVNTPTRAPGSEGAPVSGERQIQRDKTGHSGHPGARSTPPKSSDPQRTHGRKPSARRAPRKPARPESDNHGTSPRARPTPKARQRPTSAHPKTSPRARPPKPEAPSGTTHDGEPARPAPRPAPQSRTRRHSPKPTRPAPKPQPAPGWQSH